MPVLEQKRIHDPLHNHEENHTHQGHDHHQPAISRGKKLVTLFGTGGIAAAELMTGNINTPSVTIDGLHNVVDLFAYNEQINNVNSPDSIKARNKKRRKRMYTIFSLGSGLVAAKAGGDIVFDNDSHPHPLAIYSAGASLTLISAIAATSYRRLRQEVKEGGHHAHDLLKHFATDAFSGILAVGGAYAQKHGVNLAESLAAITSGGVTAWAFRPTEKNLKHHNHHTEVDNQETTNMQQLDREIEVTLTISTSIAHILIGSVTHNAENLHPENTNRFTKSETKQLMNMNSSDLDYQSAETASLESRRASSVSWNNWELGMRNWTNNQIKRTDDHHHERIAALKAVNVIEEDTTASIQKFYDRYLKGKSNIKQFVSDVAEECRDTDGTVNITKLQNRIMLLEPLFATFGRHNNVNHLVQDFILAYGILEQKPSIKRVVAHQADYKMSSDISPASSAYIYLLAFAEAKRKNSHDK